MSDIHPTRTDSALMPRYAAKFQCTGVACEDTCCAGWAIPVDQRTFQAFYAAPPSQLVQYFKHIVKPVANAKPDAHARIELRAENQTCPFLEDQLCAIHRGMGESYLSNTCATFPRQSRQFSQQLEHTLSIACPEVARLALLATDALDLIEAEVTVRADVVITVQAKPQLLAHDINEIRGFCFQLIRLSQLELWQCLAIIGHFCYQLEESLKLEQNFDTAAFLTGFVAQIENGNMLQILTAAVSNIPLQAKLFFKFWEGQAERKNTPTQAIVQHAVIRGMGGAPDGSAPPTADVLLTKYVAGLKRLETALQATPALLENYLLNEMFREMFPFDAASPYQHFLGLISRFGLLRLMLAGTCNANTLPDAATLVRTTQVFTRLYPHPVFTRQATQALQRIGHDQPDKLAGLLRTAHSF